MSDALRDKHGREIVAGDIVKVFHFAGARGKRYHMYKQALGIKVWPNGYTAMVFSHLNFGADGDYYEEVGRTLSDYEIVQSIKCDHEDRERRK